MVSLADISVEQYLENVYDKIIQYECKFSDSLYEICVLVSKRGVSLLTGYEGTVYIQRDPFICDHYLYGHRIIFVDDDYIPDYVSHYHTIRPVIVCKVMYVFPEEADVGDFVIFNNTLRQITDVSTIDGNRTVTVSDVYVRYNNFFDSLEFKMSPDTIKWMSKGWVDVCVEDWQEDPDTSAITEYFNSLTIT